MQDMIKSFVKYNIMEALFEKCAGQGVNSRPSHYPNRIFRTSDIQCSTMLIQPQTPVSMTGSLIHDNPSIFPDPRSFKPERWLQSESGLHKYLVPFSRGTRQCLGMKCVANAPSQSPRADKLAVSHIAKFISLLRRSSYLAALLFSFSKRTSLM